MTVNVRVLYTDGCANTPPTVQRIRDVACEMDIPISIRQIRVRDQAQANEFCFLGSPTVQVNGRDIDPAARSSDAFGFT